MSEPSGAGPARAVPAEEAMGETHFPAEQPTTGPYPRVPPPHVDPRRSGHFVGPPPQGPPSAVGLIWAVRDRRTFEALRRSRCRARRPGLMVSWIPGEPGQPPRVGFAVGRRVGGAVQRNLVRRRLRSIVREMAPPLPPGAYLMTAGPRLLGLPFHVLRSEVVAAIEALPKNSVEIENQ